MLNDRRQRLYGRLALFYAAVASLGYFTELFWPLLTGVLTLHLFWYLVQMHWLIDWLREFDTTEPHHAHGAWADVLDYLWSFRRRQRTEVRRLEKALQRVQTSVESLSDGLVIITRQGELQWWNEAAEQMLGFRDGDVGQALTNLVRDPHFVSWFQRNRRHGQYEMRHPRTERVLQFTNNRHAAGNRLLLVRDITRLRQLEQMRQDFVANASHELRTPLTVLQGYLEGFSDNRDSLPPRTHRAIDQMQGQTRRMVNLVNDLMLLTRLDTVDDAGDQTAIDVAALLNGIVEDARELSGEQQHRITVEAQTAVQLWGNGSELRSAFSNLVFNAVHYTPEQGRIHLRWYEDNAGVYLAVEDSGIGIETAHIPRLTERFYRVDPGRSSATGGTGLGLAIVKHALARHDARLDIQSTPGTGSTFTCCFPRARIARAPARTASA
ncbi:phosphate regulon sensor histidine kinase PhoR [Natronospirillum operosum]|uniref:Phosphate regulon sensor protein PhoR n=1 Tax=Natronospirillum operosum TaxID=2759953 RepID=A0A4Z0WE23_9GAMM|nr:phosphate regulon sensor histidine kinase PhoR [Natronospirillum operosum]TGG92391.1 phosphate regulon sensor histidine kinase PhoR [Natronospirillum operosum]